MKNKLLNACNPIHSSILQLPLCLAIFASVLFVWLAMEWGFVLTTASDPLSYVAPALEPDNGFRYLDRILNWLWIRLIAVFLFAPETVGPVSTLLLSSTTLFLTTWWLAARVQILAGAIFASLFIISPAWLAIATYTYPMQGMTLVLVATLILMDLSGGKQRAFLGGLGGGLASLCKIQGVLFFGYLFVDSYLRPGNRLKNFVLVGTGGLFAFFAVFVFIAVLDGYEQVQKIFHLFFDGTAEVQFHGRSKGGMPPFHAYLFEPAYLCAFVGIALPWLKADLKRLRPFAIAAFVQLTGLLAIYFITQRGGALIPNYVLDTFTIGIVAFSGCVVYLLNLRGLSAPVQMAVSFLLLVSAFIAVNWYGLNLTDTSQYYATKLLNIDLQSSTVITWIAILLLFALFIIQKLSNKKIVVNLLSVGCAGLILVGLGLRGSEGIKAAVFKREWSAQFHQVARMAGKLDNGDILVKVSLGRGVVDGSSRVKRVYNTFYSKQDKIQGKKVVFLNNDSQNFRYILTDQASEIINSIGSRESKRIRPSGEDFKVLISEMNKSGIEIKNRAYRGDATLIWQNDSMNLTINPLPDKEQFELLLDMSPIAESHIKPHDILLVCATEIQLQDDFFARLYVQFTVNGVPMRQYGEKYNNNHSLWKSIPKNAENIHYGWYIKGTKLNKPIVLNAPYMQSYTTIDQKRYPVALIDRERKTVQILFMEP